MISKWKVVHDASRGYSDFLKRPGIYAFKEFDVRTQKLTVVYIGKSQHLFTRLGTWHRIEKLWAKQNPPASPVPMKYLYCFILPTDDYDRKEREYIRRLRPRYNKQLNPNVRRVITHIHVS